jgi:hypothetical protein
LAGDDVVLLVYDHTGIVQPKRGLLDLAAVRARVAHVGGQRRDAAAPDVVGRPVCLDFVHVRSTHCKEVGGARHVHSARPLVTPRVTRRGALDWCLLILQPFPAGTM